MINFEKQASRMGADLRYGLATKVDLSAQPYKVWIDDEKLIETHSLMKYTLSSSTQSISLWLEVWYGTSETT